MIRLHRTLTLTAGIAAVLSVAACGGSSDGAAAGATATVTQSASSTAPPTGSGVPASPSSTAGSGGSGGGTGGSAAASGPGLCTPTVMTFAVGKPDGAAGTSYVTITATNGSSSPCVTTGYPGVALLDASQNQFLQAQRDPTVQSTTLTVAPGATVSTRLAIGTVGSGAGCTPSTAILFTLPDNTDSTKLDLTEASACDARVEAFVSGSGS